MDRVSGVNGGASLLPALKVEEKKDPYKEFKDEVRTVLKLEEASQLPFENIKLAHQILKGKEDVTVDDPNLRTDTFLVLMATLLAKEKKICFISPTFYYALQVSRFRNEFLATMQASKTQLFPCQTPGMQYFDGCVKESEVLFMHGKDFSDYLPPDWKGRKIIQIFPGENVPVDPSTDLSGYLYTE